MRRWLGGRISYWTSSDDAKQPIKEVSLRHCLYCSNGNVSYEVKQELRRNFVVDPSFQRLFHLDRFPTKEDVFRFIAITSGMLVPDRPRKRHVDDVAMAYHHPYDTYVYAKSSQSAPLRIIVLDNLMVEAFDKSENGEIMSLLMTKLSHHNNVSVLIVCHELYPKGKNSVLLQEQLTGVHIR